MIEELDQLAERIRQLTQLAHQLRQENQELRIRVAKMEGENRHLQEKCNLTGQRLQSILERLPQDESN